MKTMISKFSAIALFVSTAQACDPNDIGELTGIMGAILSGHTNGKRTIEISNTGFYKLPENIPLSTKPFSENTSIGHLKATQNLTHKLAEEEKVNDRILSLQAYKVNYDPEHYSGDDREPESWNPYIPTTADGFKECFRAFHEAYNSFYCPQGYRWWKFGDTLVYLKATDMTTETSQECKILFDLALRGKTQIKEDKEKKHNPLMVITRSTQGNGQKFINVKFLSYNNLFITLNSPWLVQKECCGINLYLGQLERAPGAPVEIDY